MPLKTFCKVLAFQQLEIFCESILKVYGKGNLDLNAQFLILALKAVIAPIFVCLYQWDYHTPLLYCCTSPSCNKSDSSVEAHTAEEFASFLPLASCNCHYSGHAAEVTCIHVLTRKENDRQKYFTE